MKQSGVILPSESDLGLPVYRGVTDPVMQEFAGGKPEMLIPPGVIATGPYSYVDWIVVFVLADKRTQQLYVDGNITCFSDDGIKPNKERVASPKSDACRDAEGHPDCYFCEIGECRQGRSVLVARLPLLEDAWPDIEAKKVKEVDWPSLLDNWTLGLLRVSSGSRKGYDGVKRAVIEITGSIDKFFSTPIKVKTEMVDNPGRRKFCRLGFTPLSLPLTPKPELITYQQQALEYRITEQFALPKADAKSVEA